MDSESADDEYDDGEAQESAVSAARIDSMPSDVSESAKKGIQQVGVTLIRHMYGIYLLPPQHSWCRGRRARRSDAEVLVSRSRERLWRWLRRERKDHSTQGSLHAAECISEGGRFCCPGRGFTQSRGAGCQAGHSAAVNVLARPVRAPRACPLRPIEARAFRLGVALPAAPCLPLHSTLNEALYTLPVREREGESK